VEETVLDLTQTAATFDDVCGWVTRAFARDLTDEARLRKAMSARPKLRWRTYLDELIAVAADGDHSVLEYRYDRNVERAHGLPEARRQAPFTGPGGRRGRRDRVYEDYLLTEQPAEFPQFSGRFSVSSATVRGHGGRGGYGGSRAAGRAGCRCA
jgi:hypothetical protein